MLSGIEEAELSADIEEPAPRYPGCMPSKDRDAVWQRIFALVHTLLQLN